MLFKYNIVYQHNIAIREQVFTDLAKNPGRHTVIINYYLDFLSACENREEEKERILESTRNS